MKVGEETGNDEETRRRFRLRGHTFIGVLATCTESLLILPVDVPARKVKSLERALNVESIQMTVSESSLVGSLMAANSHGFLLSPYALESEIEFLRTAVKEHLSADIKVERLPDRMSAAGNVILANDSAAVVHPQLSEKAISAVERVLGVRAFRGTIGGLKTVGMAAVATNRGVLAHRDASEEELSFLEEVFNLPVSIGTVNFGIPLIGAALIANSKGYAAGADTTGYELGRIEEALGFIQ
ncbi:MAG: translation initiation factor IF-6 [Canidatus Methanoxibalbensis ujae]|nr:translation initiation factor IF-6 [Candidatus Methanoxibalbensis ujae]